MYALALIIIFYFFYQTIRTQRALREGLKVGGGNDDEFDVEDCQGKCYGEDDDCEDKKGKDKKSCNKCDKDCTDKNGCLNSCYGNGKEDCEDSDNKDCKKCAKKCNKKKEEKK